MGVGRWACWTSGMGRSPDLAEPLACLRGRCSCTLGEAHGPHANNPHQRGRAMISALNDFYSSVLLPCACR